MSDDRRDDRWTQGPELSPEEAREAREEAHRAHASSAAQTEDAEMLRERQRLQQMEMMDRWIGGVLTEQRRSRRWKLFFRFLFLVLILSSLSATLYGIVSGPGVSPPSGPHLGVVKLRGAIDAESPASAERMITGLNRAWEAEESTAVVLQIDSPGGSPVQSQRIFDEILRLRGEGDKPIIAVIEDVGASGAYYIAAAADEILAAPASLVGSIGVISASFGFEEAIERLGVERRVFAAGDNKAFLDPFSELSPEHRDFWEAVLEATHGQFIDAVREGRGDRLVDDERLFSGLVWNGEQAVELGLIDGIGSVGGLARERLEEPRVRDYTPRLDPFERFTRQFGRVAMDLLGVPRADSPLRYQLP